MEFAMSGQGKRKRCKKWVTTRGYFRDIMVSCLKPRAYSRRLPTFSFMRETSGTPAGRQLSECSLMGKAAQLMTLCGAIEVRILPFRFARWSRGKLARLIPWRSQVQILLSLCCHNFFIVSSWMRHLSEDGCFLIIYRAVSE